MKSFRPLVSVKLSLIVLISSFFFQSVFCQISIVGTATPAVDWYVDFNLDQDPNNPSLWTGQILLQKDSLFKFRANNEWAVSWGADDFPSGQLFLDGANIMVDSTATYHMTFDSTALTYAFVVVDVPTISLTQDGQVGIGIIRPDESAKLDVQSISQGFLPPRMTKQQRDQISKSQAGLMLWCSNCGTHGELQVYNGIKWTNSFGGGASTSPYPSNQMGIDIDGEAPSDLSGRSVSLSADGTRLAIGGHYNAGNGISSGHVRVYEWDENAWVQLGLDIDGEAAGDESGTSVSLSADGERLAIGAPFNDGTDAGHVRVYEWDGIVWGQLGMDIDGEAGGNNSGQSVSLSGDGTRLAIGAKYNTDNGVDAGHTRVYEWDGSAWIQLGLDIDGEIYDQSGTSVSLSVDGLRLAIGSPTNDDNGGDAGKVRVYEWEGSNWVQLGLGIVGESESDHSGWSVSLSGDGTKVAIGSPYDEVNNMAGGSVGIYEWNGSTWAQLGDDIEGEAEEDQTGWSVSMSADGTRVAIGSPDIGHVRLFEWDGIIWVKLGVNIDGEGGGDDFGTSVSLSADGTRLAIGAPYNSGNGNTSGHVRVYE